MLSIPTDPTTLGRGRGRKAVIAALHRLGPSEWIPLTDIARHPLTRGVHFSALMSACDALTSRKLIEHRIGRGDEYRFVPHTHDV